MKSCYTPMHAPKGSKMHNDSQHERPDLNQGGGPAHRPTHVSVGQRGGVGARGRHSGGTMGKGRGPSPNPAGRGSDPGSFHADQDDPNRGGGPQPKGSIHPRKRGGFGHPGQVGVPGGKYGGGPVGLDTL